MSMWRDTWHRTFTTIPPSSQATASCRGRFTGSPGARMACDQCDAPALAGKRVLDLGCGFGWFARWARAHGATSVLGIDLSERMIARAQADTADAAIEYRIADLELLELPEASFDWAYSALTFHYVADFGRLAKTVHRSLVPGALFVFTIEHPIYMAATHPRWFTDEDGRKTWPVNRYAEEGERRTDWLAKGVLKYHRRIGTTLNTLIDAGFAIRHVEEFAPTADHHRQSRTRGGDGTPDAAAGVRAAVSDARCAKRLTENPGPFDGPGFCLSIASARKPDGWRSEPARVATPDQTHPSAAAAAVP